MDVCDDTPPSEINNVITNPGSPWYGCGPSERDLDGDGIMDAFDACPITYGTVFQGCPFADRTTVNVHEATAGGHFLPNSGTTVKVFDRSSWAFQNQFGLSPHVNDYPVIYESGVAEIGSCVTDTSGQCSVGEKVAGEYLVLAKFNKLNGVPIIAAAAYGGEEKSPSDFVNGIADKEINFVLSAPKGNQQANWVKRTRYNGSILDVYYAAGGNVVDGNISYYPYVFISDSSWNVDVCAEVPEGYIISAVFDADGNIVSTTDCLQALVANESNTFLFEASEVGSPEPSLTATIKLKGPNGKKHSLKVQAKNIRKASHDSRLNKAKRGKLSATMDRLDLASAAPRIAPRPAAPRPAPAAPKSNILAAGESLWKFALRHLGPAPASNLANLVSRLARANSISIPEWGISGSMNSRALRPGLKLLGL